ncbi:protease [Moniliophthora roreri MCA 2997]|uniref:Protease n=1 Tax=Moniliophthora roreri (strain MCA 2997) TaxID=1381753 RepID=V2X3X1_MONRO|nr:protease [Moniliophthora roreri MCA 2997]
MVLDQTMEDQKEIFDLMGEEAKLTHHSIRIPIQYNVGTETVETKALIDSGAGGHFISEEEARHLKKPWMKLDKPIKVYNVDGTRNKTSWIIHSVTINLTISDKPMTETLLISGLGPERMILGLPWLQDYNPDIDWITGVIRILDKVEDDKVLIRSFTQGEEDSDEIQINAKLTASQVLAQTYEVKAKLLEEFLPTYLSDYSD